MLRLSYKRRCKFTYDFSTGIPLNILITYGKDPKVRGGIPHHYYIEAMIHGKVKAWLSALKPNQVK